MPVVRNRERNRSNSSSPKLLHHPCRTISPRTAAGHRSPVQSDVVLSSKSAPCSSRAQSLEQSQNAASRNVNNIANPSSSSTVSRASNSPLSPSTGSFNSTLPLGMSLRNHTRTALAESHRRRQELVASSRNRGNDFSTDFMNSTIRNSDLPSESSIGTRQQMFTSASPSSSPGSSNGNNMGNNNTDSSNISARPRSRPQIRLITDLGPDDIFDEKGPSRKRRRLMDMMDTNVPRDSHGYLDFVPPNPFEPLRSSGLPAPPSVSRAPSRLSSSSSSSDGTNIGGSSVRSRRLSARKRNVVERQILEARSSIYNSSNMISSTTHAGLNSFSSPTYDTFCQTGAISASHLQQMNHQGISSMPHMCCNVCPMQRCHPNSIAHSANRPYHGVPYPSIHAQQQRHNQQNAALQMQQQHRTSQGYVPQEMIPGSLVGYQAGYGQMMDRSQHHNSSQHRQTVHQMLNNGARQQYSTSRPGHVQTAEALFGMSSDLIGSHNWVPGRRMPENVTPAAPLSQQMNISGHMNPGVALHMNPPFLPMDYGLLSHMGVINPRRVGGGQFFPPMDATHHHHHHDSENYELFLSVDRMGEAKQKGLTKSEIEKISCYKYKGSLKSELEQVSCVICISEFELKQTLRVLPCSHEFHAKCIDKWLKSNRTCPICRCDASSYFLNKKPRVAKAT